VRKARGVDKNTEEEKNFL
jgi:coiled-coil domain-containing protein 78